MGNDVIRVCIVDDDAIVVRSLETILGASGDIEVVGTGTSSADAMRLVRELAPDVLLCDIQMPDSLGLDAADVLLAEDPDRRIVFLTTFSDEDYIARALSLGAKGYLIKQNVADIAPAVRAVYAGQSVLGDEVVSHIAHAPGKQIDASARFAAMGLTEREIQVVELIAQGLGNAEIASTLYMGEGTVRNHISAILQKLQLRNRTQIAVMYYRG